MTDFKVTEFTQRSICPCPRCGGTGVYVRSKVENYHDYYEVSWNEFCSECKGEGRVVKIDRAFTLYETGGVLPSFIGVVNKTTYEPLNGRKTADIYPIGKARN